MATNSFDKNIHIRTQEDANRIDVLLEKADKQSLSVPNDLSKKLEEGEDSWKETCDFEFLEYHPIIKSYVFDG